MPSVSQQRRACRVGIGLGVGVGALSAANAGLHPTGANSVDLVESLLLGAVVCLGATYCRWWLLLALAAGLAVSAPSAPLLLVCLIAGLAAIAAGQRTWWTAMALAGSAAALVTVLTRLTWPHPFGATALLAGIAMAAMCASGLSTFWRRAPRTVRLGVTLAGFAVVASGVATVLGAWQSRHDIVLGRDAAKAGQSAVREQRYDDASASLRVSAAAFSRSEARLTKPWLRLSDVVPVLAQYRRLAVALAGDGHNVTSALSDSLAAFDPASIRPVNATFDLPSMAALEPSLAVGDRSLRQLQQTVRRGVADGWIFAPVRRRLATLLVDIDRGADATSTGLLALRSSQTLLGADGERNYLVLFVTPAEARGLGGYAGNFAVLSAKAGHLKLNRFGRISELFPNPGTVVRLNGTPEWQRHWADFGGRDTDGTSAREFWQNITMTPDLPTVGTVARELYAQVTGQTLDGLIVIDPFGLASVLELTGPLKVPALQETLEPAAIPEFLLRRQYQEFSTNDTRVDALAAVAEAATRALLEGSEQLPDAGRVAEILGEAARANHLSMWSRVPEEERFLRRVRADNAFPERQRGDVVALVVANASGDKLDAFSQREVSYTATVDLASGLVTGEVRVKLTNAAAAEGLPDYVYGNRPSTASNRAVLVSHVVLYSSYPVSDISVNGVAVEPGRTVSWEEYGAYATALSVALPAGSVTELRYVGSGKIDLSDGYLLALRGQTSASRPDRYRVRVLDKSRGTSLLDEYTELSGVNRWTVPLR